MIICSIIQVKPDIIVLDLPHSTYFLKEGFDSGLVETKKGMYATYREITPKTSHTQFL